MQNQRRTKRKANLINIIGFLFLFLGVGISVYIISINYFNAKFEEEHIESYLNQYDNDGNFVLYNQSSVVNNQSKYDYVAILEIPKINLKKGLVMSTNDFKSINYAISIDQNSNMPNEEGNLILYAHAGNSRISYFKNLNKLIVDDNVNVYYLGKNYSYRVNKKYEIEKTGFFALNENYSKYNLILITCVHNTNKQLVIICTLNNVNWKEW